MQADRIAVLDAATEEVQLAEAAAPRPGVVADLVDTADLSSESTETEGEIEDDEDDWEDDGSEPDFVYDPVCLWYVIQPCNSHEIYVSHFDDESRAELKCRRAERDGCETLDPDCVIRTPLEQVGPLLLDYCRRLRAGVLPADHEADLDRLLAHAAGTEHLDVVVATTRRWWDARPGSA